MNYLGIDYGTKRVGLATAVSGVISPLAVIPNDQHLLAEINKIVSQHQIHKIYVGMSEGGFADITKQFVDQLKKVIKLPVETVNEAVSTIEAQQIYRANGGKLKKYRNKIDAVSAAVILNRLSV